MERVGVVGWLAGDSLYVGGLVWMRLDRERLRVCGYEVGVGEGDGGSSARTSGRTDSCVPVGRKIAISKSGGEVGDSISLWRAGEDAFEGSDPTVSAFIRFSELRMEV